MLNYIFSYSDGFIATIRVFTILEVVVCWPLRKLLQLIMRQFHCAESTAERGRIDHSCSVGGSFLVIVAMTMTMTINSNRFPLIRVTSAGQHKCFEHVQNFCVPNANTFHSWLCTLKTFSYLLCRTAYVLYFSHSNYVIYACNILQENSAKYEEWSVNVTR